jgi:hypothetical protein
MSVVSQDDIWAVGFCLHPDAGGFVYADFLTWHFDGTQWNEIPIPNIPNRDLNELMAVSADSPTDVWAIGWAGCPEPTATCGISFMDQVVEHYDGTSWQVVLPTSAEIAHPLNGNWADEYPSVWALSPSDAWICGGDTSLSWTNPSMAHWDGTGLTYDTGPQTCPNVVFGSNDMWLISGSSSQFWNGSTWASEPPPLDNVGDYSTSLSAFSGTSDSDLWAVGSACCTSSLAPYTLTEHFDGTSWSVVSSPPIASSTTKLNSVAALSPSIATAAGTASSRAIALGLKSGTWSQMPSPPKAIHATAYDPQGHVWGIADWSSFETWNGTTWKVMRPGAATRVSISAPLSSPSGSKILVTGKVSSADTTCALSLSGQSVSLITNGQKTRTARIGKSGAFRFTFTLHQTIRVRVRYTTVNAACAPSASAIRWIKVG